MKARKDPGHTQWEEVKKLVPEGNIAFGGEVRDGFHRDAASVLRVVSRYKFAARLIGGGKKVLDAACGEGLGTWLLALECGRAHGVEADEAAVGRAQRNFSDPKVSFERGDFISRETGLWDAIVTLGAVRLAVRDDAEELVEKLTSCLEPGGVAIVGTEAGEDRDGKTREWLEKMMLGCLAHVFMFEEQAGLVRAAAGCPGAYLIGVGCRKR